jgi:hypothetical protein
MAAVSGTAAVGLSGGCPCRGERLLFYRSELAVPTQSALTRLKIACLKAAVGPIACKAEGYRWRAQGRWTSVAATPLKGRENRSMVSRVRQHCANAGWTGLPLSKQAIRCLGPTVPQSCLQRPLWQPWPTQSKLSQSILGPKVRSRPLAHTPRFDPGHDLWQSEPPSCSFPRVFQATSTRRTSRHALPPSKGTGQHRE